MCSLVELFRGSEIFVASVKWDFILNIVEQARLCPEIEKIVLFGSSLTEDCIKDSDIEFGIIGSLTHTKFFRADNVLKFNRALFTYDMAQEYAMSYYRSLDDFYKDFSGTVIYDKGVDLSLEPVGRGASKYGYLVVHERGKVGSSYYEFKDEREAYSLGNALSLAERVGLQIIQLNNLEIYGEYAPYKEITNVAKLFILVGSLALNKI